MRRHKSRSFYKMLAMILSVIAMLLWSILGTGASVAWFSDTDAGVKNIFHIGEFSLIVSHRPHDTWEVVDSTTKVFNDEALYEPGYVQVVYLKAENAGTVPFNLRAAVSVTDYTPATNVFGQSFNLQDYLKFGVVFADTEAELESKVASRELAVALAGMSLNNYTSDEMRLEAGEVRYMALVVRMPEDVGNVSNYRGATIPRVELGVILEASQIRNMHALSPEAPGLRANAAKNFSPIERRVLS